MVKIIIIILNSEFRAANVLADILFLEMKKNPDFKLRIPIHCEVEYKGFKALVMVIPMNKAEEESNIVSGPTISGEYKYNLLIVQDLIIIAEYLKLKKHKFEWDPRMKAFPIFLSVFTEI